MKSEPTHMTDGRDFNFAEFTNQDDLLQSLGGDAHNAAASINGSDSSYLLGLDNDYLLAPFESGNDIFAFRGGAGTAALGYRLGNLKSVTDSVEFVGSPSPPESQEQSPKSINTSPNSSESSPPQIPGVKGPDGLTMMHDVEDDFPMLDETSGTITFPLSSSSSNGFFGSNFTPLVPAPTHLPVSLGDKMAVDDTAKFFDFESAASSPLAVKLESQRQSSVPRFFPENQSTLNPQLSFNSDSIQTVSTPTYPNNRKKRRSSVTLSPNSTEALASFTFDSHGHPSPASSAANGISQQRNGKRHNSTSTSGEDETATLMKSTGFRPTKAFSISNMWSPSSFSSASPMPNMLAYTPVPANGDFSYKLTLRGDQPGGRINEKSRVETQIRVNLNLAPLPPGVTKLHLPTHTISKPKLLSKPPHQKTTDTLELYTSLICASSVEGSPELLQRVLQRAIDDPLQERVFGSGKSISEDGKEGYTAEEDKPLNGGEVRICSGCITRERKRAARKKIKKVEEEESWARDESKRIIVFNCSEVLEWGPPEAQKKAEMEANDGEIVSPIDGNAEIWLPMRIACYCRHQSEKSGFRIILTIKDHNDNLVAQNITPPILITDDHKTNAPSQPAAQQPVAAAPTSKGATSPSAIAPGPIPVAPAPPSNALPYSASDTNLLTMGQIDRPSKASKTGHSRQNSRQSSVGAMQSPPPYAAAAGPSAKKRKANPSSKARSELTMTKIDTSVPSTSAPQSQFSQPPFTPSSQNVTMGGMFEQSQPVPFTPSTPMENGAGPNYFGFHNRNHSIDSLHGLQIFSAPTSAQGSRVPSRVASPVQQFSVPQGQRPVFTPAQFAQVQSQLLNVANGQLSQALLPFDITRIVPTEGPCQGGIEVTILGSGFQRSHTVYFGDKQSPRTEYWSDTTIVCLLPPSSTPGSVPVVMRYAAQANLTLPGRPGRFIYTDDTEQKMLALALQVINAKWSGKIEPPKDIAMRLLMDEKSPGNAGGSVSGGRTHSSGGNSYNMQALQFLQSPLPSMDMEAQLLKLLDIIDMDDSPFPAKLNLRNRQGQTLLHHACALGYNRFTAALLARGANPDAADKGGFTPAHFAALKGHKDIVRRLRLNKADFNILSLSGVAPEGLTDAEDIRAELGNRRTRSRRPSVSSVSSAPGRVVSGRRSRSGSIASAMASWEPFATHDEEHDENTEEDDEVNDEELWIRPKRTFSGRNLRDLAAGKLTMIPRTAEKPLSRSASKSNLAALAEVSTLQLPTDMQIDEGDAAPAAATAAALVAIREQLANLTLNLPTFHNMNWNLPNLNLQNFQQQMHLNLQNLQGQTARFNALLQGQRAADAAAVAGDNGVAPVAPPVTTPQTLRPTNTEGTGSPNSDYKWWELFSPPNAPPAYEELYPDGTPRTNDSDNKLRVIGEAVAQVMDAKVAAATAVVTQSATKRTTAGTISSSSSKSLTKSKRRLLTTEEQDALRIHHEKMKRIKGDQRLLFFWLPIFVLVLFTLLTSWGSKTWIVVRTTYDVVKERMAEAAEATAGAGRRVVEVGGL
ncbi:hypothetical protein TWF594_011044 [Orbilia oligospora]|uniref:IPT/TIG domain-containing protein n=1 Tax=Orbilia oligospora TaxID=2813651 RepID=A0A7C8JPL8_ORBOL|nr:hypothetical protein TWF103_005765 [Orbilia oligospora]KAF3112975.1 hypothetical protein TWF706_009989 [Orbilia oligospora]KAF3119024.1 hypothetical protein TWF703_003810 [Orbilia oligospora]KAF3129284.1 hypothetical protein TWF594_011044 [Orbilia oligospora]